MLLYRLPFIKIKSPEISPGAFFNYKKLKRYFLINLH